jgi:hypothetical protein
MPPRGEAMKVEEMYPNKTVYYRCEYYSKKIGCNLVEPCIFDKKYDSGPWSVIFMCPIKRKRLENDTP